MRKVLMFACLLLVHIALNAQDYFTGKMSGNKLADLTVFYDRSQIAVSKGVFRSSYKVLDKDKKLIYNITITHFKSKASMYFEVKKEGGGDKNFTVKYEEKKCGLIFSDAGNLDTVYDVNKPYKYLVSFTDTKRDYPVLHKMKLEGGWQITLDPLTKIRLKKHREAVKNIFVAQKATADDEPDRSIFQHETFIIQLMQQRKELYRKDSLINLMVLKMMGDAEGDVLRIFKTNRVSVRRKKYDGASIKGKPEGKGLLASKGSIYQGVFSDGKLDTGVVVLAGDGYDYAGQYAHGAANGVGGIRYFNGGYIQGRFKNGVSYDAVTLAKSKNGDVYFGDFMDNLKTGYGELRNTRGDYYYGEFKNGVMVKGYARETDPFGYIFYSLINEGSKTVLDPQTIKWYFDNILKGKK